MSENSKIEWCDHTFNPWIGCTKVSPGCTHCYAEVSTPARVMRADGRETWGKGAPRSKTQTWGDALRWDRLAEHFGQCPSCGYRGMAPDGCGACGVDLIPARPRVFCASLADWLDDEVPIEWLAELMTLIGKTPNLDWLLLTKRPKNFRWRIRRVLNWFLIHLMDLDLSNSIAKLDPNFSHCLPVLEKSWEDRQSYIRENHAGLILVSRWLGSESGESDDIPPLNVWIGTTVEDQTRADERIPILISIPATVRFLSCEPLLGPVKLTHISDADNNSLNALTGDWGVEGRGHTGPREERIHWVIAGGESGPNARPMHPDWARSLRDQCQAAGVPILFKQWGEHIAHPAPDAVWKDGTPVPVDMEPVRYEKVGKKAAGRILDGREWTEFPKGGGQ